MNKTIKTKQNKYVACRLKTKLNLFLYSMKHIFLFSACCSIQSSPDVMNEVFLKSNFFLKNSLECHELYGATIEHLFCDNAWIIIFIFTIPL